ncbi:MAG TPA: hypothetical protein VL120_10795 [Solirubrobacteraceae bacterium]|jgi:hypothetical protein|nr:hypothetical protein [Solirubrobacteraceae bacterium]
MSIKMTGRYEPGSEKDRAHKLLVEHDVKVDHVYGVDLQPSGMEEITFTFNGKAQTAFAENENVVHVTDGWDVLPPKSGAPIWRGTS